MAVYTGSAVGSLTLVAQNDDYSPTVATSQVVFTATAGSIYQIAVDGYNGASGTIALNLTSPTPAPANDQFVSRISISTGDRVMVNGTNVGATKEVGEPSHAGNAGGKSVWWSWTAPESGLATINTLGSTFDTLLAVYTGSSVTGLTLVAQNDNDSLGGPTSSLVFSATSGTTYQIAVDGYNGLSGNITLSIDLRPANDAFDNRIPIVGSNTTVTGRNTYASKELSEPNHAGNSGGASVWWTWTAPASGRTAITTTGSTFTTLIAVYTGDWVGALRPMGQAVGSCAMFDATAGTTYQIAIDGYNGASGNITLSIISPLPRIMLFSLDSDPGWTRSGEWAFGPPMGGGNSPDPLSGATGNNVYGINLNGNYSTNTGPAAYLIAGPFNLTGYANTHVSYQRWLNSDYVPYVTDTVDVSNNGTTWTRVWDNGTTPSTATAWSLILHDISAVADNQPNVYIRWGHQVTSGGAFARSGWNIDDIELAGQLVTVAPSITTQPVSQTVTFGSPATFTAAANGTPAPTYQWKKNGVPIGGATSASITLSNVAMNHAGSYTVVATGDRDHGARRTQRDGYV